MVPTPEEIPHLNRYFLKIPDLIAKKPCKIGALENAQKTGQPDSLPRLDCSPDGRYGLKIKRFRQDRKTTVFFPETGRSPHRCSRSIAGGHPGIGIPPGSQLGFSTLLILFCFGGR